MEPRDIAEAALTDLDVELARLRRNGVPALSILSTFAGTADAVRAMLPAHDAPWLMAQLHVLATRHALPITELFKS